jgi:hypothetical protein
MERNARMPPQPLDANSVFLNIPYDEEFSSLYVAYIVGLFYLGLVPHLASEIPGGAPRLQRISALVRSCRYSIHDLSRIELSTGSSPAPRFNMPLELGMTITWADLNPDRHTWFVFESEPYRIQRSTSDLNGTDAYIHGGSPEGILRELRNAFWRGDAPSVAKMLGTHRFVVVNLKRHILPEAGASNIYAPAVFRQLCLLCSNLTGLLRRPGAQS